MRSTRVRWNNWDLQYASHTSEGDIGTLENFHWGERTEEERYQLPIPHLHCPLTTRFLKTGNHAFSVLVWSSQHNI